MIRIVSLERYPAMNETNAFDLDGHGPHRFNMNFETYATGASKEMKAAAPKA